MKLYKYFNLSKTLVYACESINKNTIWCSSPSIFNDPEEFKFRINEELTFRTTNLLTRFMMFHDREAKHAARAAENAIQTKEIINIARYTSREIITKCRDEIGVFCFSAAHDDKYLWCNYGGRGDGICIEYDIADDKIGKIYHPVDYVAEKTIDLDTLLESGQGINTNLIYKKILATKHTKWAKEKEVRFISNKSEIGSPITGGHITQIIFGGKLSVANRRNIEKKIESTCRKQNISFSRSNYSDV